MVKLELEIVTVMIHILQKIKLWLSIKFQVYGKLIM